MRINWVWLIMWFHCFDEEMMWRLLLICGRWVEIVVDGGDLKGYGYLRVNDDNMLIDDYLWVDGSWWKMMEVDRGR